MCNYVFVLDANHKPLNPCRPVTARKLLTAGKAAVYRRYPFTIILKKQVEAEPKPMSLKIDPGSKMTGLAIVYGNQVVWSAEIEHRGSKIKSALDSRRAVRRSRRNRKCRYRKPRFNNRKRPEGWLAPSLQHRVATTMTWVLRLIKLTPIGSISQELVRFDTQKLQNPEISGIEYQQGELMGYEVREYLYQKWDRQCVYCGAHSVKLEIEHIVPKSKGGTNRVSNLTLACHRCNQAKGNLNAQDFLLGKPDVLKRILARAKQPLLDAAAVNSTRWKLYQSLKKTGLSVEVGTGGRTKYNRIKLGLPKSHWIDAACVGEVATLEIVTRQPLLIKAMGHGCRQVIQMDGIGFPRKGYKPKHPVKGWKTGDIVNVVAGKNAGLKGVRIKTVRAKGNFDLIGADQDSSNKVLSASRNYIQCVHRQDGYYYSFAK
ncbi:MAG: HNH endonuclease [Moorea sp. SIO3I7]|uniref:RNA-guided endonuclease IscB n=1 Tax=Moorena sp. SIO3I8 TaxID=2607833 RepID=UPI0013BFCE87|nr:RNA-guided endonuclease IscB [Moorena sp. SIO3I8]NEN96643.1 HNH endonuclease [Moorena sp. SIO3I7]NEO07085.1 HNH endonuclease [Moorena sp. SIO3I8]